MTGSIFPTEINGRFYYKVVSMRTHGVLNKRENCAWRYNYDKIWKKGNNNQKSVAKK